jgi:hypothetical protein
MEQAVGIAGPVIDNYAQVIEHLHGGFFGASCLDAVLPGGGGRFLHGDNATIWPRVGWNGRQCVWQVG